MILRKVIILVVVCKVKMHLSKNLIPEYFLRIEVNRNWINLDNIKYFILISNYLDVNNLSRQ